MPTIHRVSFRLCCAFFLLWLLVQVSKASSFKAGKAKVTTVSPGLFACQEVSFATPFHGGHEVTVLASLGRSIKSPTRGNGGAIWVESVDQSGFKACILEYSDGSNNTAEVNWIATQSAPSGGKRGSISLGDWTTGTQCKKITFQQPFLSPPVILVTPSHKTPERPQDAMAVWMEDSRKDSFKICLKESKIFDGVHKDIKVNWMAYTEANFGNFTLTDSLVFMKNTQRDNYAFCQRVNFTSPLFAPPVVALTPKRSCGNGGSLHEGSVCDAMTAWVEYTSRNDMEICTKNYHSDESMMSILAIDYLVIGDLDPCINVTCGYYRYCKALAPHVVRCVCADICPSYKEPVCSSNGTTYDNKCLFEQETCSLQLNFTIQHPGSCEGFPLQRGHRSMPHTPSLGYSFCKVISLEPFVFYPDKPIEVQITVNHQDTSDKSYVHDASVSWVENVNNDTFTACVMTAGFNERTSYSNVTVDWLAYQGAPAGGVAGVQRISQWWTGTTCETVKFPSGKFSQKPLVFVTVAHHHAGLKRDAASVWLEDITASSCKICLRELQNYAGSHKDIFVNWLAYSTSQKPFFSEQNSVYFANSSSPPADFNNAFCKDIHFNKVYRNVPNVLVSANHSSTGGNVDPMHNSITAWVEYINTTGARVCLKELYESKNDPLSIQYMVLSDICKPGWSYFGGYCYITSQACTTWLTAVSNCSTMSSSLVTVHNQNENVYIQHRLNGEKSWIGLNDRSVEGLFVWSDGESSRFRFWARNQPNNWKNEDCVHTLGSRHGYTWNDVPCDKCHKFTCYTDLNECSSNSDDCDVNAICHNTVGSYTCTCKPGYIGDGRTCHIRAAASWSFTTNRQGRYGSIQTFTVPKTTRYRIRAWGARGGTHSTNYGSYPGTYYGGKGAYKEGTFTLNKGTVLNIVVGQRGGDSVEVKGGRSTTLTAAQLGLSVEDNAGTGGGGGSFVYTTRNVLLLAAGGGGGASSGDNGVDGQSGTSGTSSVGKDSSQVRRGGSGGSPGQCNSAGASYHGGVGAGWSGQGCSRAGSEHGERGGSRAQGWVGGRAGMMNSGNNGGPPPGAVGGFGGGGGGSEDNGASGGGGGYSGGGSGTHPNQAGGGGGSYCSGSNCSGVSGGNSNDNGLVKIVELSV